MIWLAVMAACVAIGWLLRLPSRLIWAGLGLLCAAAIAAHLVLPTGHALRAAAGADWRAWSLPLVLAAVVLGYRRLLRLARARALPVPATVPRPGPFAATELERYARHIVLREIGGAGQKKLKSAKVLVIGAGGLGSPSLLYLAAAGVGTIGVIDDDVVSNSNLQRQIIHTHERIGQPKVQSAELAMKALNPYVTVRTYQVRLDDPLAAELFADYDLIVDGSDNFDTRYLANRAAVHAAKPLVSAAINQWEGQISVYHPAMGGPCFECVFPERPAEGLAPTCAEAGVVAPLPGVVGAMMALEAVKALTGAGKVSRGALLVYDGLWGETRQIRVKQRPDCPVCGRSADGPSSA